MVPAMSESQEQAAVLRWFRLQYPRLVILAIPNGSHLAGDSRVRAIKMARMKREGLLPGAADLFIAVQAGGLAGLWIEMKAKRGSATPAQLQFGKAVSLAGYHWEICHGADEAMAVIKRYLNSRDPAKCGGHPDARHNVNPRTGKCWWCGLKPPSEAALNAVGL